MLKHLFALVLGILATVEFAVGASPATDIRQLEMAVEYFQSGKFHEALLLFRKLDASYSLNKRMRAFMGVCYYYEREYDQAAALLDSLVMSLDVFAPKECLLYYKCCAESHYHLGQYPKAIELYKKGMTISEGKELGYIYSRLAFCWFHLKNIPRMQECLKSAVTIYRAANDTTQLLQIDRDVEKLLQIQK